MSVKSIKFYALQDGIKFYMSVNSDNDSRQFFVINSDSGAVVLRQPLRLTNKTQFHVSFSEVNVRIDSSADTCYGLPAIYLMDRNIALNIAPFLAKLFYLSLFCLAKCLILPHSLINYLISLNSLVKYQLPDYTHHPYSKEIILKYFNCLKSF